jgi:enoyl-CoA hydratase
MYYQLHCDGGVAEFVLTNPPANAFDPDGFRALAAAFSALEAREDIKVLVLRGEGRGFCAGIDVKRMGADPVSIPAMNRAFFEAVKALHDLRLPVIAAVHGYALGAGLALAGAADILIGAEGAKFGLPEINVGLLGGASHALRILPLTKVRQMYFTGEPITSEEMYRLGAVEKVVPADALRDEAMALARKIAEKDGRGLRFAKEALNGIEPVDLEKNYRYEQGFTFEITYLKNVPSAG